jgi:hypothetical protein
MKYLRRSSSCSGGRVRLAAATSWHLIAALSLLAGCATVELAGSWKDPGFTGPALRKVLVIGAAQSETNRRLFEDSFSQVLKASGVTAVPGYTLIPVGAAPSRDQVRDAVAKAGADAVIVTRVGRAETRVEVTPTYYQTGPYRAGLYGGYGTSAAPAMVNQYEVFTLETTLWQVKTEKVVWGGTSRVIEPQDVSKATAELAEVLIAKMRADGVL